MNESNSEKGERNKSGEERKFRHDDLGCHVHNHFPQFMYQLALLLVPRFEEEAQRLRITSTTTFQ